MDNEAGHKRKEFGQKSKSALKKFWHDWFGDISFKKDNLPKPIQVIIEIVGGLLGLIFSLFILLILKELFFMMMGWK